jgi:hypothetical protein
MMTPAQRQQTIERLEMLRNKLNSFTTDRTLLRELPPELLTAVKQEPTIGTVTSSGIERIASIIIHLNWVILFLKDPNFPYPPKPKPAQTAPTPAPAPTPPVSPPENQKTRQPENQLDFGPFQPKS